MQTKQVSSNIRNRFVFYGLIWMITFGYEMVVLFKPFAKKKIMSLIYILISWSILALTEARMWNTVIQYEIKDLLNWSQFLLCIFFNLRAAFRYSYKSKFDIQFFTAFRHTGVMPNPTSFRRRWSDHSWSLERCDLKWFNMLARTPFMLAQQLVH